MHENHLFEYAVIRIVPRVEREEFFNVGVVLYCPGLKFLQALYELKEARLRAFCAVTDIEEVRQHLQTFQKICAGVADAGPIGRLDIASRFRWLTATRSTIVQTSKVHAGFCADAADTLERLYQQLAD